MSSIMKQSKEEQKKAFRAQCLRQLEKASGYGSYFKDKKTVALLYDIIKERKAKEVMAYLPLKSEVNLYGLITRLRKEKRVLYVPFMEGASFRLVKYRLPLKTKQFGIKEPNDSKQFRKKKLDMAIVPMVGTDATHRRVGFGKGMYDRFFEKQAKSINYTVFVARHWCYSPTIVTDDHDVKADMIITAQPFLQR
ncbi:MAG: 5-formyltetrahydrofolate cyclo-ligase [Sulfurovum sp. 28-43-6]|nr:MAG: 5-formyltetrahydrofolate cyclo-ligase [Sulfurovum sp. 35-42-20]OYY55724.1 MAG: 5-formyltetrahydrofolate cyclo-ligase [Sulfurovum sp. 28-43-6]OYZ24851.1 MAG: 5-formyltetrahydrofolate cyclo-ligase [Sulfurovum sp. 16-42-52]OYZ50366.1 MAG: 5-formyltetrahydrofolate cyclo-ligase [Sulfurovum sp. 24-42-9]OZA44763.1 MAG: 5-formyltetrahydrofolate cyclo-ligase [Sulfurovum sp. 17-42-90]OZA59549.1 MAG: 5-formyltetrahydrofolate cyclo-ligase [Sulfurovum sp. 39-42-12]